MIVHQPHHRTLLKPTNQRRPKFLSPGQGVLAREVLSSADLKDSTMTTMLPLLLRPHFLLIPHPKMKVFGEVEDPNAT